MHWIKFIHVSCVAISFSFFFIRGVWMLYESPLLNNKWVKIFPHIIDSVLLLSALSLLYVMNLSLVENDWLIAKTVALFIYVILGTLALKHGRTKKIRSVAFVLALMMFVFIVSTALTKSILFIN